jgi:hypothetical protein
MSTINVILTEKEIETVVSGLLFSCSVNVVANTDKDFQLNLLEVATKVKNYLPSVELTNIQFLKEENYEDDISEKVLKEFENNLKMVTFEEV